MEKIKIRLLGILAVVLAIGTFLILETNMEH